MPPDHFVLVIWGMRVLENSLPGWTQTEILPITASQGGRITAVSYWYSSLWVISSSFELPYISFLLSPIHAVWLFLHFKLPPQGLPFLFAFPEAFSTESQRSLPIRFQVPFKIHFATACIIKVG
jgi:hypothetical protein